MTAVPVVALLDWTALVFTHDGWKGLFTFLVVVSPFAPLCRLLWLAFAPRPSRTRV